MNKIRSTAALLLAIPLSASAAPVRVRELLDAVVTASGQPITLPQGDVHVVVSTYEVAPGVTLPEHEHHYQRYGYMLSGELRITNTETGKTNDYKPGDFIVESRAQWHKAESIGHAPVKLLVIDQVNAGENNVELRNKNATVGQK
jgi:quercetin dioxygenase-like cupin family protein